MQMRDFQQVAGNPCRGGFTTDERQLEIQREYRASAASLRVTYL